MTYENEKLLVATHEGKLHIGNAVIDCAVLDNGQRVLTTRGVYRAIGKSRDKEYGYKETANGGKLPVFWVPDNLKPFVDKDFLMAGNSIEFVTKRGLTAYGFEATVLPEICKLYIKGMQNGVLRKNQMEIAENCVALRDALVNVAIVTLVDSVTCYMKEQPDGYVNEILTHILVRKKEKWVKTYRPRFYQELYRIFGFDVRRSQERRKPKIIGKITNEIIYKRILPGVMEELKRLVPRNEHGNLVHKYHQHFSEGDGRRLLNEHIAGVISIMILSDDKKDFFLKLNRVYPPFGETPLFDGFTEEELFS